jgi:hypothetical protein
MDVLLVSAALSAYVFIMKSRVLEGLGTVYN